LLISNIVIFFETFKADVAKFILEKEDKSSTENKNDKIPQSLVEITLTKQRS